MSTGIKSFIYIEIRKELKYNFSRPLIDAIKKEIPEISCFDLDSMSAPELVKYAQEMLLQSEKTAIVFDCEEAGSAGRFIGFLEKLIRNRENKLVFIIGKNEMIEKMLKFSNPVYETDTEAIVGRVKLFFS